MAYTRRDYINQVIRLLDLTSGTKAGQTDATDGNPANIVYTSDQTFTDALNDGAAAAAMECIPLYDTGTKTTFTGGPVNYTDLTVSSGNRLWQPEGNGVTMGGANVIRGSRHYVQSNSAMGTVGTPFLYWYPQGQTGIYVTGVPTPTSATLSVFGFAVPKLLTSTDADTFPAQWLKPEDAYTVVVYAAARVCEKRASSGDALLGNLAPAFYGKYAARRQMHRDRLTDAERSLLLAFDDGATGGG